MDARVFSTFREPNLDAYSNTFSCSYLKVRCKTNLWTKETQNESPNDTIKDFGRHILYNIFNRKWHSLPMAIWLCDIVTKIITNKLVIHVVEKSILLIFSFLNIACFFLKPGVFFLNCRVKEKFKSYVAMVLLGLFFGNVNER